MGLRWIGLVGILLLCAGCATTDSQMAEAMPPWYQELNPMNDRQISDWALLDLDTDSYSTFDDTVEDMRFETVGLLW